MIAGLPQAKVPTARGVFLCSAGAHGFRGSPPNGVPSGPDLASKFVLEPSGSMANPLPCRCPLARDAIAVDLQGL